VRRLAAGIIGLLLLAASLQDAAATAACAREDFGKAVVAAGVALRALSTENQPRIDAKLRQLKTKMRWPDAGYEEMAYQALHDERIAELDAAANALLAKIDVLGTVHAASTPECSKLAELSAASLELQATVKTKTAYLLSKLDQMLADPIPEPKTPPRAVPEPKVETKTAPVAKDVPRKTAPAPKVVSPEPKLAAKPPAASTWSAKTEDELPPGVAAPSPPEQPANTDNIGFTIEEIREVSAGFFGQVSANLGGVIEHAFRSSGRPTAYILGTEGGGAFLAGVRYGKGLLYQRGGDGKGQRIFWHGPTVGADVGGEGSKVLFLIYKLKDPEELYTSFTGVAGSAYLVGGVGFTLVSNGNVVAAPIRSGLGLRLGASVGYIRFTPRSTWNPF
jgi:hypothetical protein